MNVNLAAPTSPICYNVLGIHLLAMKHDELSVPMDSSVRAASTNYRTVAHPIRLPTASATSSASRPPVPDRPPVASLDEQRVVIDLRLCVTQRHELFVTTGRKYCAVSGRIGI